MANVTPHRNLGAEVHGSNAREDWLRAIDPKRATDEVVPLDPNMKHAGEVWAKVIALGNDNA